MSFTCDGCSEQILPKKARIHCEICPNYDLCANCFVVGQATHNHVSYHPTALIKTSGLSSNPSLPPPPPLPARTSVLRPPATPTYQRSPSIEVPVHSQSSYAPSPANASVYAPPGSAQQNINYQYHAPAPAPAQQYQAPQLAFQGQTLDQQYATSPNPQAYALPPPPPQNPQFQPQSQAPQEDQSRSPSHAWQPLFDGEMPTQSFVDLMTAFFVQLDPHRMGTLTPEVYSSFLDAQGYETKHNVCK
jgi:hypothetical protein